MDAKITKQRLGHLLSYDWLKMIGLCALAVALILVLFSSIAARATGGHAFDIYTYGGVYTNEQELGTLDRLHSRGALSYETQDMRNERFNTGALALSTRLAAGGRGDVLVAVDGGGTQNESGEYTALEGLKEALFTFSGFFYSLSLDGKDYVADGVTARNYFARVEAYLGSFYRDASGQADWQNGMLDEDALHDHFYERIADDRRYRTERSRREAFIQELERVRNLREAYIAVKAELQKENGLISVKTSSFTYGGVLYELPMAIDLSALTKIGEVFVTNNDSGNAGLSLCLLNTDNGGLEDLQFEVVTFLYYLMKTYA